MTLIIEILDLEVKNVFFPFLVGLNNKLDLTCQ